MPYYNAILYIVPCRSSLPPCRNLKRTNNHCTYDQCFIRRRRARKELESAQREHGERMAALQAEEEGGGGRL